MSKKKWDTERIDRRQGDVAQGKGGSGKGQTKDR